MRRQVPIANRLYSHLYPEPGPDDPQNFSAHLGRNLVPEVRIEVSTFYGDLKSDEARYPGLNYCYGPHRMRLGRFPHHRQLFAAFDTLCLTNAEIEEFCCWEGTKWARERYEKDEGIQVLDTTGDEIKPFVDPRLADTDEDARERSITRKTDISVIVEEAEASPDLPSHHQDESVDDGESDTDESGAEDSSRPPDEQAPQTRGVVRRQQSPVASMTEQLSQWLLNAPDQSVSLVSELDQLLKEHFEEGSLPALREFLGRYQTQRRSISPRAASASS